MPKHRGHNEGSVYQRPDGRWVGQITTGYTPEGKPKRATFYGKTKKEILEKLNEAKHQVNNGTYVEPSRETVGHWLSTWLTEYVKPHVRPTTRDNYAQTIRKYMIPEIGHIQLRQLTPTHLQKLYNDLLARGLSNRTVRLVHTIAHASLKQALENGLVARNVADATKPPRPQKQEMRVLSPEEEARFLEVIEEDRLGTAFLLDLATGLRRGELLALRWSDVDLKEGTIHVNRTIVRVVADNGPAKTALVYQEPKTKHGRRAVPIPEALLPELKAHKARQAQEKLLLGPAYEDNGLVFCAEDGRPLDPASFGKHFAKLAAKAGISGATLHSLRHTYATRLLEANEHPKVVQELLGHSNIAMTLDTYSHVMPELKKAAAAKLNGLFTKKKAPSTTEGN